MWVRGVRTSLRSAPVPSPAPSSISASQPGGRSSSMPRDRTFMAAPGSGEQCGAGEEGRRGEDGGRGGAHGGRPARSEEHTSELQSLMRTSYAVFCLKKKKI